MNIIKNKNILKGFGQHIDQLNTLAGGVTMAHLEVVNKKNKMVVTVDAPSVRPESIQVLVEFNKLVIYATLPQAVENKNNQTSFNLPLFARAVEIPSHVAVDQITAIYQDERLNIILPFAEDQFSNRKFIQIEQR